MQGTDSNLSTWNGRHQILRRINALQPDCSSCTTMNSKFTTTIAIVVIVVTVAVAVAVVLGAEKEAI